MRIKDVRAYTLLAPLKKTGDVSAIALSKMISGFMEVETDTGWVGEGKVLVC